MLQFYSYVWWYKKFTKSSLFPTEPLRSGNRGKGTKAEIMQFI